MGRYWKVLGHQDDYGHLRRTEVKFDGMMKITNDYVREYGESLQDRPDEKCLVFANETHWYALPHNGQAYKHLVEKIMIDNGFVRPESNHDKSKRALRQTLKRERDIAQVNAYRRLVGKIAALREVGLDSLADDMQKDIDRLMK